MKTLEELILEEFDGKPTHCAKAMGISNKKLYNLMRYNLHVIEISEGCYVVVNKDTLYINLPESSKKEAC